MLKKIIIIIFAILICLMPAGCNRSSADTYFTVTFECVGEKGVLTATIDGKTIKSGDKIKKNSDIVFSAMLFVGYKIKEWKLNDNVVESVETSVSGLYGIETYPLTSLNKDINLTVEFEVSPRIISAESCNAVFYENGHNWVKENICKYGQVPESYLIKNEIQFNESFNEFPPSIDFENEMLLIYCFNQSTGGGRCWLTYLTVCGETLTVDFVIAPGNTTVIKKWCLVIKMDVLDINSVDFIKTVA